MANKGKVKLEKLEKIEIDEEKVKQAVEATLKQIIDLTKVARLAGWKIGCLVSNNTAHLNKKEKGYYFTVISQKTGLTEGYIKQCETFYHKFPTLPRLLADTGLPVGFFHWLAMKGLSQYQVEEWVKKNLALLKDKDLRELKTIAKNKFEIQGNLKYLPVCQFCQQELEWPDRKGSWDFFPAHFSCWNNYVEEINKTLEELRKEVDELRKEAEIAKAEAKIERETADRLRKKIAELNPYHSFE